MLLTEFYVAQHVRMFNEEARGYEINQSINQLSINQSVSQSVSQPINQFSEWLK